MLRMGKNPKAEQQTDTEHNTDSQTSTYNTSPSYGSSTQQQQTRQEMPSYRSTANDPSARAISESESLARDIKEGTLSGFVGNGTTLTGEASFKGMLRVDGHLSGRVSSDGGTLIVGNNGQVDANIEVAVAQIQGTVNGDIVASQRLELGRAAKVFGNIQTPSLVIEQGAVFEGSCRMMQQRKEANDKENAARGITTDSALDTTGLEPVTDTAAEASSVSSYSDIAS